MNKKYVSLIICTLLKVQLNLCFVCVYISVYVSSSCGCQTYHEN